MKDRTAPRLEATSPVFLVADVAATLRWYEKHLGFRGGAVPAKPPHNFGIVRRDDVEIMLQRLDGYRKPEEYGKREGGAWNVFVRTRNVQQLFEELSAQGEVEILEGLCPQDYGQLQFVIRDPNGYVIVFAETI